MIANNGTTSCFIQVSGPRNEGAQGSGGAVGHGLETVLQAAGREQAYWRGKDKTHLAMRCARRLGDMLSLQAHTCVFCNGRFIQRSPRVNAGCLLL